MRRFLLELSLGICLVIVSWGRALANAEFTTSYNTTYRVNSSGVTRIELSVGLRNKLSNIYADKFSLSVGYTDLKNIRVSDAKGTLAPVIEATQNQTTISFQFMDRVVGKDKINNFFVSFDTDDVATKNGSVWEVNIPPLEAGREMEGYLITLEIPTAWGEPAFVTPGPTQAYVLPNNLRRFVFDGKQLGNKPVSAVFGRTQFIKFDLKYNLENLAPVKAETVIALPPNTNYQELLYESINPLPQRVMTDGDGNWLAYFKLNPGEKKTVEALGIAKLNFVPGSSPLSAEEAKKYLLPTTLWQTENEEIKRLAGGLKTPKAIFDYVTDKLSYDYTKLESGPKRLGAVEALVNPLDAICTEFTDLFVAIARAAGIPARELEGFAFTNNEKLRPLGLATDVLHAWPEYYSYEKQRWIQIDPTWTVTTGGIDYFTKLDLNHMVFVIHGRDPVRPLPAGAYKLAGDNQKNVKMEPIGEIVFPGQELDFELRMNRWGGKAMLIIRNVGKVASAPSLVVSTVPSDIIDYQTRLETLPPGGEVEILLPLRPNSGLGWSRAELILNYANEEKRFKFGYRRKIPTPFALAGGIGFGGVVFIATFTARRIYLRRRRKASTVYW